MLSSEERNERALVRIAELTGSNAHWHAKYRAEQAKNERLRAVIQSILDDLPDPTDEPTWEDDVACAERFQLEARLQEIALALVEALTSPESSERSGQDA